MAQKETLQQFVQNLPKMPALIQKMVMADWGKNTLEAMRQSKLVAPKKEGWLQKSARMVRPKLTENGIVSAFIFGVPYAYRLEIGKDEKGRELHIVNEGDKRNPRAQSHYGAHGVNVVEPKFMEDLKRVVSAVWRAI